MLLALCALGAVLIAAGATVSFGPGIGLIVAGTLTIAWAVAFDLLAEDDEVPG